MAQAVDDREQMRLREWGPERRPPLDASKLVVSEHTLGRPHVALAKYDERKVVAKEFREDEVRGLIECRVYQALRCATILQALGHCQATDDRGDRLIHLVLEYALHGSLARVCKRPVSEGDRTAEGLDVSLARRVQWLHHITQAVAYLHSQRIVHRDIKPDNVMLREDMTAALGDFEFARKLHQRSEASTDLGTPGYTAPEVCGCENREERYSYPADVYSFGITVVGVLVGSVGLDRDQSLKQLEEECTKLPGYASRMALLHDIAILCTQLRPRRRPAAQRLCFWFGKVLQQWDTLEELRLHEPPAVQCDTLSNALTDGQEDICGPVFTWLGIEGKQAPELSSDVYPSHVTVVGNEEDDKADILTLKRFTIVEASTVVSEGTLESDECRSVKLFERPLAVQDLWLDQQTSLSLAGFRNLKAVIQHESLTQIRSDKERCTSLLQRVGWLKDIAEAICYLLSQQVQYVAVDCDNVWVCGELTALVTVALPEMSMSGNGYSLFSYGITVVELLTNEKHVEQRSCVLALHGLRDALPSFSFALDELVSVVELCTAHASHDERRSAEHVRDRLTALLAREEWRGLHATIHVDHCAKPHAIGQHTVYVADDQGSNLSQLVPSFEDWAGVSDAGSSHLRGAHEEDVVLCKPGFDFAEFQSSVHNMISSGQYDQEEKLCSRSSEAVKSEFGNQSSEYAYALFLYGQALRGSGRLEEAKEILTEALTIEAASTRIDAVGRIMYVLAIIQSELGDRWGERSLLEEVLGIFKESGDKGGVAGVKGALASTMQALGDLKGSKTMYEEVLAIEVELHGEGDIRVANAKVNLAQATGALEGFAGQGKPLEEAIRLLTHQYSTREHLDVARALSLLAEVRRTSGDIVGMKELLEEVVITRQKHYGTREHAQVAIALEQLATAHGILGELTGMIARLEEVLIIREKLFGRQHENTAITLHNLALARQRLQDDEGACKLLEEAVAIYELRFGARRHPEVATTLCALAECTRNLGDAHGARRLLEEALATRKELFGERSKEVAMTLRTLSSTEPDLKQRRKMLEDVLEMLDQRYGAEEHVVKCEAMSDLASVLGELGDHQREADMLQDVVRMLEQAYGTRRQTEVTSALFNLANAMSAVGRHQDSKDILEEVLSLQEHVYGSRLNVKTSRTMANLANAISALGGNQSARNMLEEALCIQEQVYGTRDHPEVVVTLWNLSRNLGRLGDTERMMATLRECMMIQARLGDRRHASVPM